jgi:hypothetical protein
MDWKIALVVFFGFLLVLLLQEVQDFLFALVCAPFLALMGVVRSWWQRSRGPQP